MLDNHTNPIPRRLRKTAQELLSLAEDGDEYLFQHGAESELIEVMDKRGITDFCATEAVFPYKELANIFGTAGLTKDQNHALQVSFLTLQRHFIEVKQEQAERAAAEDETTEEETEEAEEAEETQGTKAFRAFIKYLIDNYTFKEKMVKFYQDYLSKNPHANNVHQRAKRTSDSASEAWQKTRETLKTVFSLIGLDSLFLAIDLLAKRSPKFKFFLQALGTATVPIVVGIYVIWTILKWTVNPLGKVASWFAREVDFKVPVPGEDD